MISQLREIVAIVKQHIVQYIILHTVSQFCDVKSYCEI